MKDGLNCPSNGGEVVYLLQSGAINFNLTVDVFPITFQIMNDSPPKCIEFTISPRCYSIINSKPSKIDLPIRFICRSHNPSVVYGTRYITDQGKVIVIIHIASASITIAIIDFMTEIKSTHGSTFAARANAERTGETPCTSELSSIDESNAKSLELTSTRAAPTVLSSESGPNISAEVKASEIYFCGDIEKGGVTPTLVIDANGIKEESLGLIHSPKSRLAISVSDHDSTRVVHATSFESKETSAPNRTEKNYLSTGPKESYLQVNTDMANKETPKKNREHFHSVSPTATSPTSSVATTVIEHRHVNKSGSSTRSMLFLLRKPIFAILAVFFLGMTGASTFFLTGFLTIPGLQQQIKDLESQIDRLETQVDELEIQVDRLEKENYRFESLNDELVANNAKYVENNERLEAANNYYDGLNQQFNASNSELEHLNERLKASNEEYGHLNKKITTTMQQLNEEVDVLEVVNSDLTATLTEYIVLSQGLSNETGKLDQLNDDLTENVSHLNETLSALREENNRLYMLLDDLSTIVSFLDETTAGLERSYASVTSFLAEQITANKLILIETLHNTYSQRTINWVCGLSLRFATESFASDGTTQIGTKEYPKVVEYIEYHVFANLCLDTEDFEKFLIAEMGSNSVQPANVTTNELVRAVYKYSNQAMDYYFSNSNKTEGLSYDEWSSASYMCKNLPPERQFLH